MIKAFLITSLLIINTITNSVFADVIGKDQIQKVVVFRNSAQIESKFTKSVPKGEQLIIIDELPSTLREESIQVNGASKFTILSVEAKTGNLEVQKNKGTASHLLDSIETYNYLIELDQIKKYAIDQEESLLISNKELKGKESGIGDIEDLADLYRRRIPELKKESYNLQKLIKQNTKKLNYFQQLLAERQSGKNNKQIWVRISNPTDQNISFNLIYLVGDAGWSPIYDIRSEDIGQPLEFILKAKVWQRTGIDWNNVDLSLSSGNPANYTQKPQQYPWVLRLSEFTKPELRKDMNEAELVTLQNRSLNSVTAKFAGPDVSISENVTNIQYDIEQKYSVASDGNPKMVEIQKNNVAAEYRYVSIPKLNEQAYLIASIKDWDQLMLQRAEANIFMNGAFVNKTIIDPKNIEDSLEITLGNDEGIIIERKLAKETNSTKSFGGSKKIVQGYDITVRNNKKKAIRIDVLDQVPLSTDKNIEVKHTANGANFNSETGNLTWSLTLNPSEVKNLTLQLEIKYPKSKVLEGW